MNYNFETLANLIVLLAQKVPSINVTKLLKMLYLIDERAMIEYGVRVTWLDYSAWERGPVIPELYCDLQHKKDSDLFNYIETHKNGKQTVIIPKTEVNYDFFSRNEMNVINAVIEQFKDKSASWLVDYLHESGTQWHKVITENKLDFKTKKTSDYKIDLSNLVKDKPIQNMFYQAALESIQYQKDFNNAVYSG